MKYNLNNKILEAVNRGIKFALDDYEDEELQGQTNSKVSHKHGTFEEILLMQGFVDLDLPSGTLWNAYNLGVDPDHLDKYQYWNGGYYQWGETEPAFNQLTDNEIIKNKFVRDIKQKYRYNYNTGKKGFHEIQPEDDPVSIYYKSEKYHIPSEEQFEELKSNTTKKFVKNYKNVQLLDGLLLTGKNGKEIFFPANGFIDNGHRQYFGEAVYCWTNNKSHYNYTWHDTKGNIVDTGTGDEYGSCCFSYHNSNSQYDYISISDMVPEHAAGIRPVINL